MFCDVDLGSGTKRESCQGTYEKFVRNNEAQNMITLRNFQ